MAQSEHLVVCWCAHVWICLPAPALLFRARAYGTGGTFTLDAISPVWAALTGADGERTGKIHETIQRGIKM